MGLRAVVKAGGAISSAVPSKQQHYYRRDDDNDNKNNNNNNNNDDDLDALDYWEKTLLPELTSLRTKCPNTFDESALLNDPEFKTTKRAELQRRFLHLREIMKCVGCDRCKLWGTLQTIGIGT